MPRKRRNKNKGGAPAADESKVVGGSKADALKEKGNKAFGLGDYGEAIQHYTGAIADDPAGRALYSNRSAAMAAGRDFIGALADAEKCIGLAPEWPKGYFRKGTALEGLLRYQEANKAFQDGVALDPEDPSLKKSLAELSALLEELKMTETEMNKDQPDNPDGDKFDQMVQWLRDGGALFPKLYLQYYDDDYRGVHCLAKVPNDDVILFVPFKYIMTSEVAKESEIGKRLVSSGVNLRSKHSYLAAYLLQEKYNKNSFWTPYLKILPERYANMPLFFDEPSLAMLEGSFTLAKIADRIQSLRQEYDNIKRAVPEFGKYTQDDFVWARLVVITRIFGLVINGHKTDGLVPYADMLNHKRPRETKWTFDDPRYGFIITSLRAINRGEQVFDSYGAKCNSRFFVNYGFALSENPDNEALMRVELPRKDPHFKMKLRFLGGREICAKREYQIPANYNEKKCKELFSFMRFTHAQDSELMLLSAGEQKLGDLEPISIRNEIMALKSIKAAAQGTLATFPGSLADDQKMIEEGISDFNTRNCVIMRAGEKAVLQWFSDLADQSLELLGMSWKNLKRVAAKAYKGNNTIDMYITQVVVPLVKNGQ